MRKTSGNKNIGFWIIISIIFLMPYVVMAKNNSLPSDILTIKNELAIQSYNCIIEKENISKDNRKEIKELLKRTKYLTDKDRECFYLWNLLNLCEIEFVEKNYKKANSKAIQLIEIESKNDTSHTSSSLLFNLAYPTWSSFKTRNANKIGKKVLINFDSVLKKHLSEEGILFEKILEEIPLTINENIIQQIVTTFKNSGANQYDLSHVLLRFCEEYPSPLINDFIKNITEKDEETLRPEIFRWSVNWYRTLNGENNLNSPAISVDSIQLKFPNIKKVLKSFIPSLYDKYGLSSKDDMIKFAITDLGEEDPRTYWIKSRDTGLLFSDNINWIERVEASLALGDSVALSKNIIKGLTSLYNSYNYKEVITTAEKYRQYILPAQFLSFNNLLGLANHSIGRYDTAIEYYNEILKLYDTPEIQKELNWLSLKKESVKSNLAFAYSNKGDYHKALALMEEIPFLPDSVFIFYRYQDIIHYDNLGNITAYVDLAKAKEYFEKAEDLKNEKNIYISDENKIWHYLSWASVCSDNKKLKRELISKTEELYENNINNALSPMDPLSVGRINFALGKYYYSLFDYEKASIHFDRAVKGYSMLYPEDRRKTELVTWKSLNDIELGKTSDLKEALEAQLSLQIGLLGKEHYDCYQTRKVLLKLAIAQKDKDLALKHYDDFKSQENKFAREELNFGNQFIDASILCLIGNEKDSYEILDKVDISLCEASVGLQSLELKQKLANRFPSRILVEENKKINREAKLLSSKLFTEVSSQDRIEWARRLMKLKSGFIRKDGLCNEEALDFSLFTKGLLLRSNKHAISLIEKTKAGQKDLQDLNSLKDSLSYYLSIGDSLKNEKFKRKYNDLEVSLISKYLTPELMMKGLKVEKSDVMDNLSQGDIAIEFIRYTDADTTRYGAFILGREVEEPIFITICDEPELISRSYYDNGENNFSFYRDKNNKGFNYDLIWKPLESYINNSENVYFSGDGLLNQLAIEFLPDKKDVPVNQKYKLHRVFHLADIKKDTGLGNYMVAIGVSDYNSPIKEDNLTDRGSWSDLGEVEKEFDAIRNSFRHNKVRLAQYLNNEATEEKVKSFSNINVSALHFATHGFYKSYSYLLKAANDARNSDYNIAKRSIKTYRSSLSGLILRGGNISWKSSEIRNENDDILTSEEIENLNFPSLQLTTLSACETGLGDVDGEGVWGLQRAFRIAGTKSLICSLCKVSDKWTSRFMKVFYESCNKGNSIYDSFQTAQRYLFQNTKKDSQGVTVWPSFILIE